MPTKYESCPFCNSKSVEEREMKGIIVVYCRECNNKIDVYPKE